MLNPGTYQDSLKYFSKKFGYIKLITIFVPEQLKQTYYEKRNKKAVIN